MKRETDSLGRATFAHIATRTGVRLTSRDLRWLKHIERHGPQSSSYLYESSKDTHRCRDTALRQMQKLRAGGYLMLPAQQRNTAHADFNAYIYDLTQKGRDALADLNLSEPTIRPHGHWVHDFMTACATASIDVAARHSGIEYIPGHKILAPQAASLAIPIGKRKLIPDQFFALNYGSSFRVFALEVDRGSEPKTSNAARKSYASSIQLYHTLIERQLYRSQYGLKANLLVLWVFSSKANEERFLEMVANHAGSAAANIMTQSVEGFQDSWRAPELWSHLFEGKWRRAKHTPVQISKG
ncbi:replication-relaxation family protein [Aliiroseovarius sp. KMU-50]|uniref:Replication-relaxation family protein n=1 Tax=Aliiroseovarius salicola TaxID=3009082 RepID=A0ABT4W3B5_9RHOB|nr:replication-relaxation family protein [Aliiroseovarius sp. KMU-50]MDA5095006.1 replication-relaxation family protein [Aliiroseovarius sp. KMU-50]